MVLVGIADRLFNKSNNLKEGFTMPARVLTYSISRILSLLFLIGFTGCATLNESECKTANWEIIGLEDGSQGRPTSYIGQHRQACAEYQVAPDLDAYLKGHTAGLRQFCTADKGYQQAVNGQANKQICPGDLAQDFNSGYAQGMKVFKLAAEVRKVRSEMYDHEKRLDEIKELNKIMEEELVGQNTTETRRRALLKDIKELERETEALHIELDDLSRILRRLENRHEALVNGR